MNHKKLTVLDCTLRDGGYYNNWDFPAPLVARYLAKMADAKIDAIEIGFRAPAQNGFFGAFAYSTDDYLRILPLPPGVLIGVMVNAKDLITYPQGALAAVDSLFQPAKSTPIGLVRIAAHFSELSDCQVMARRLKELGYQIGLNLMQATGKSEEELTQVAKMLRSWEAIDVLYFADSLGNMSAEEVRRTIAALAKGWNGSIGIHTHNNMGQALNNSLAAIDSGVSWVDATILGMGRGAGNACTELLLLELEKLGHTAYDAGALFQIVLGDFSELRSSYGWGPNLLYHLSASYGIHPTYVQEMMSRTQYENHQIIAALEFLKDSKATSYRNKNLQQAMLTMTGTSEGRWDASGWSKGKDLLVVGAGPSMKAHLPALTSYVEKHRPTVVSLNIDNVFPENLTTAYVAAHPTRLLIDADRYHSLKKPLICPVGTIPAAMRKKLDHVEIYDYGMRVEQNLFSANPTDCTIPTPLAAAYALALGIASHAKRILFAGFDGYVQSDPRQKEMEQVLQHFSQNAAAIPLIALTPTTYPIQQSSIYSPII